MITCLLCGRAFRFLPSHLARAHGTNTAMYREEFDIPAGTALADDAYRESHRRKVWAMQADGRLDYAHLGRATEASRGATRVKRGEMRDAHRRLLDQSRPWEARQLPPGAKRADGRDADRAREYQRQYRRNKHDSR